MSKRARVWFCVFLAVVAYGVVGRADYEDELKMQQLYCQGVENGDWPDYNSNYNEVCK